jgi:hypothetical protein
LTSHAGYLEPLSNPPVRGANDLLQIDAAIYMGVGCSIDVTAVLYDRATRRRLGTINGHEASEAHALWLSGFDVGDKDANGERVVASGWTFSNCTSNWNGKRARIDRLGEHSRTNLLLRGLDAKHREPMNDVDARVRGHTVTFRYESATDEGDLIDGPTIARYRIEGDRAIRQSPLALTRVGFIYEWLRLNDSDAGRWSEPEALRLRKTAAAGVEQEGFEWKRVARCGGAPHVWEVAIHLDKAARTYVFHIAGERATELRMVDVTTQATASCKAIDIKKSLDSVGAELPW